MLPLPIKHIYSAVYLSYVIIITYKMFLTNQIKVSGKNLYFTTCLYWFECDSLVTIEEYIGCNL